MDELRCQDFAKVIATRDIMQGEELYADYGSAYMEVHHYDVVSLGL